MRTDRPFQHIVDALRRANGLSAKKPSKQADDDEDERAEDESDDDNPDEQKKKKTKKKSRGEIEEEDQGDERRDDEGTAALAQKIIQAGEMRRNQQVSLPANRTARLVVLASMKRRGEISDSEYEQLARG
jgi:hypothetical protein